MKKFLLPFAMLLALGLTMVPAARTACADDFIDLDLSAVAPNVRGLFRDAEQFWESRINGYSASLPSTIRAQLTGRLSIAANTFFDAPGGLLGFAGPTATAQTFTAIGNPFDNRFRQTTVVTAGEMSFDLADAGNLPQFAATIRHEMAHVLGIGTLWEQNGIINITNNDENGLLQRRNGLLQYVGRHGLRGFRDQSGHTRANYVPTENFGGPGTAFGHWAGGTSPNWFFAPANGSRVELMTGFATGSPSFVSEATWGSLADVGWSVDGFNAGFGALGNTNTNLSPFPKSGRGGFLNRVSAVPEPSSIAFVGFGLMGLLVRRKRA